MRSKLALILLVIMVLIVPGCSRQVRPTLVFTRNGNTIWGYAGGSEWKITDIAPGTTFAVNKDDLVFNRYGSETYYNNGKPTDPLNLFARSWKMGIESPASPSGETDTGVYGNGIPTADFLLDKTLPEFAPNGQGLAFIKGIKSFSLMNQIVVKYAGISSQKWLECSLFPKEMTDLIYDPPEILSISWNPKHFFPDDTQIVMAVRQKYEPIPFIFVLNTKTNKRSLVHEGTNPIFLLDGENIVFENSGYIYEFNTVTGEFGFSTSGHGVKYGASWTQLIFSDNGSIFTMNTDGTNRVQITHGVDDENAAAGLNQIAFVRKVDGVKKIFIHDLITGNEFPITPETIIGNDEDSPQFVPSP